MPRSEKIYIWVARILTVLFLIAFAALCVILPPVVENFCSVPDLIGNHNTPEAYRLVLICSYLAVLGGMVAMVFLLRLLSLVEAGKVFGKQSLTAILAIAICCFAEVLIFLCISYYFQVALSIVLAIGVLALCLLVVRSVLVEAARIKAENDLTV